LAHATAWPAIDPHVPCNLAVAVGFHHGIFPTNWDGMASQIMVIRHTLSTLRRRSD
jgi:hypothetical protein